MDGTVVGDGDRPIRGVCDLRDGAADRIGFVRNSSYLDAVASSRAGALIVPADLAAQVGGKITRIEVDEVGPAYARIAQALHPPRRAQEHRIHPNAAVDPGARLEEPVEIGPGATLEAARVAAGSILMAGCFVGADCVIGRDCLLWPGVILYPGVQLGDRVVVHGGAVIGADGFGYAHQGREYLKIPQVGTVVVGDDVEIGAGCTIDRGTLGSTRIGRGTKIDNLVHLGHNCVLGEDNAVAGLCALSGSTVLGDRVVIGGHTVSAGHLRVADDVRVGGNSVLHGDISEPGDYLGYPLMGKRDFARHLVALRKLGDLVHAARRYVRPEGTGRGRRPKR